MKYLTLLIVQIALIPIIYGQNKEIINTNKATISSPEKISLKERSAGKRKSLYLVNNDSISHNIFFVVNTDDYALSNSSPLNIKILPKAEVKVLSMVLIDGKEGKYDYTLKIKQDNYVIDLKKDAKQFNTKLNTALKNKDITIFIKNDCNLCNDIKKVLKRSRVPFKQHYFKKDSIALSNALSSYGKNRVNTFAPVVKIDDSLYNTIKTPRDLIIAINNHLN